MLIILHGENDFLSRRKLNEIVEQYKAKHKSGLNFSVFDSEMDFFDFKSAYETISMFDEKKLIVLKGILQNTKSKDIILSYIKNNETKIKNDKDRVIVIFEYLKLETGKNKEIKHLFEVSASFVG